MQGFEEIAASGGVIGSDGEDTGESRVEASDQIDGVGAELETDDGRVEELEAALAAAVETIAELEKQLAQAEQAQDLERLLIEAGVVDIETATLLAQQRLNDAGASVEGVVSDLVSSKSFLFRSKKASASGSAVSGDPAPVRDSLSELADEARQTGDRRAVLRYLRRRRG
ncbi:MAG: hypothetical protein ED559_01135 [Phycisphaera sp.]|nr:MAG: hypothetical protein ED559_01135 [Phycisphaera sp.]